MSKTAILNSGANYFIKCLSENKAIKLDQVIFANINGVDSNTDIDKNRMMPLTDQIVHTMNVTKAGLINSRTVVYSTILDTTIGDFSFNFIGLVNSETNTLCMALHTDTTRKIKTIGQQQGNTITESIWLEIDNASDSTGITVNAETWQIDYSARLLAEDERIRKTNFDLYGRLGITDGLAITKEGNNCTVNAGIVYVAGLRVNHESTKTIQVTSGDSIYIDAALEGTTTGAWQVRYTILTGSNLKDYQDGIFTHFVEKIASIDEDGTLIAVKSNKVLTELDKSSAINSDSESTIATSKSVKTAYDLAKSISDKSLIIGDFKLFPFRKDNLPSGWYFRNGDNYLLSSKQGQILNSFSDNYKSDHNITIKTVDGLKYINVPNAFNGSGYGYFERAVDGVNRQVGSIQDDASRNISGWLIYIGHRNFTKYSSNTGVFNTPKIYTNHSPTNTQINSDSNPYQELATEFNSSRVVPTANENRPINYGLTPAIYLGV